MKKVRVWYAGARGYRKEGEGGFGEERRSKGQRGWGREGEVGETAESEDT